MPKDVLKDPSLPFPGEYGPDGFATQYIKLDGLTNVELSEHCKTFKLPHSGNKAVLAGRLNDFSKDKSLWERLLPGATNSHKGKRKTEKKSKPKTSALRQEQLFEGADSVRTANTPVTERSKDLRTQKEKDAILPWAKHITSKYPYQPNTTSFDGNASMYLSPKMPAAPAIQPNSAGQLALEPNSMEGIPTTIPQNTTELGQFLSQFVSFVQEHVGSTATTATSSPSSSPSTSTSTSAQSISVPSTTLAPTFVRTSESGSAASLAVEISRAVDGTNSSAIIIPVGPSHSDSDSESPTRTPEMAGGKLITFRESDIPDPPAVSYAKSIEDLLCVWTDNSPRWNGTSPLKISGVPIPIVYWPIVYKYWKRTQWQGVKKAWFDWKILVRSMTRTTLDDFWAHFSAPDKTGQIQRMKYTRILQQLTIERKAENEKLTVLAKSELTAEQLTYRKGAQYLVMTKPSMIAAYYRKLKGLDAGESDNEDD
ncbi:hypothetical protein C8R44DRAFT_684822 [Mycena epipterygia]|nr:hypothetical protein C8R44DRAFT_684822 [Mycena epipterygia]